MHSPDQHTQMLISFVILLIIAGLTSYYAERKGRNPAVWFVIGILLGFFAPLILFFVPSLRPEDQGEKTTIANGNSTRLIPPPPPQKPDQDKLWYYLDQSHHQYGPVSTVALKELWDTGRLELTTYVWSEGMEKWETVDALPHLKETLKKVQL